MDEQKRREEIDRAVRVNAFFDDDEFKAVILELTNKYRDEVMNDRESNAYWKYHALVDVVSDLRSIVDTGKLAAQQLRGRK